MQARKKKILTVLCVGSVILVWRGYGLITRYAPSVAQANSDAKAIEPASAMADSTQDDENMKKTWEQQRLAAEQPWGRNPCVDLSRPAGSTTGAGQVIASPDAPPAPAIKLSGVSRSGDQWLAAVEGNIVRVGDEVVGGYRVINIAQHSLTLESAGWTFTFTMGAEDAVVRPSSEVK